MSHRSTAKTRGSWRVTTRHPTWWRSKEYPNSTWIDGWSWVEISVYPPQYDKKIFQNGFWAIPILESFQSKVGAEDPLATSPGTPGKNHQSASLWELLVPEEHINQCRTWPQVWDVFEIEHIQTSIWDTKVHLALFQVLDSSRQFSTIWQHPPASFKCSRRRMKSLSSSPSRPCPRSSMNKGLVSSEMGCWVSGASCGSVANEVHHVFLHMPAFRLLGLTNLTIAQQKAEWKYCLELHATCPVWMCEWDYIKTLSMSMFCQFLHFKLNPATSNEMLLFSPLSWQLVLLL